VLFRSTVYLPSHSVQDKNEISRSHSGEDFVLGLLGCNTLKMETVCFPKRWYLLSSPHDITTQKTKIDKDKKCTSWRTALEKLSAFFSFENYALECPKNLYNSAFLPKWCVTERMVDIKNVLLEGQPWKN
jgi:hypothetical protein